MEVRSGLSMENSNGVTPKRDSLLFGQLGSCRYGHMHSWNVNDTCEFELTGSAICPTNVHGKEHWADSVGNTYAEWHDVWTDPADNRHTGVRFPADLRNTMSTIAILGSLPGAS